MIYSGNMFNDLPDVPYVITMDIRNAPDVLDVPLPNGSRVCYTRIDHTSKAVLGENVGEVSAELMSKVNTNHFMVISTD